MSETQRIEAEAVAWVERADREDWCAADQNALEQWLGQSPAHKVCYLRARDAWQKADRLVALRGTFGRPAARAPLRNRTFYVCAAAGIVALLLPVALWLASGTPEAASQSYSTAVGGHKVLALADGSQIELNTDTRLRTEIDAKHRSVWIDRGEAYFQITHDAARPFVVYAGTHRITDLGTKFVVRSKPDELQVTLVEGRAEVDSLTKPGSQLQVLSPGDVAVATANAISVVKRSQRNLANEMSWRRGVLVFDRTTVADAAAQLNRYNTQKIVIADSEAAQERIEGTFPSNNIELFGRVARSVLGLHVEKRGGEIVISH